MLRWRSDVEVPVRAEPAGDDLRTATDIDVSIYAGLARKP
jgi:hypothetical protein